MAQDKWITTAVPPPLGNDSKGSPNFTVHTAKLEMIARQVICIDLYIYI